MPSKKKEEAEVLAPAAPAPVAPVQPPTPVAVSLQRSEALRKVVRTMRNGAATLLPNNTHPFSPHPGFMTILNAAYRQRDMETFLYKTREYLEQAAMHVPQAGRREEIPGIIEEMRALCTREDVGFEAVALHILRIISAPF